MSGGSVSVATGGGAAIASGSITVTFPNNTSTGTTLNKLAKITGDPARAVITATTDVFNAFGIVVNGAGITGDAEIAVLGAASCVFDNATTALNYVVISSTVAGAFHDAGAAEPVGVEILGRVLSTGAAGTKLMNLFGSDVVASNSSGGQASKLTFNSSNPSGNKVNLSDITPAAEAGYVNVKWQKDSASPTNVSAEVPIGTSGASVWAWNTGSTDFPTGVARWYGPIGLSAQQTTEANAQMLVPIAGTFKKLYCRTVEAPGSGNSYVFLLRKDTGSGPVDGNLTCTVTDLETTCYDKFSTDPGELADPDTRGMRNGI